jgi:predicted phosphodiesterase
VALPEKPPVPDNVLDLNGQEYPQACYELKDENHFFVIGDWGGMCGWGVDNQCGGDKEWNDGAGQGAHDQHAPRPMWNRHNMFVPGIDDEAQQRVAAGMDNVASQSSPDFVVSVGDHFYPGGIAEHCNGDGSTYNFTEVPQQFQSTFEDIYNSSHMAGKEWMGVLGNHDYGGVCVNMGWPQQVYYTWNQVNKRWVLPAQYYSRNLRFSKDGSDDWDDEDFTIDMFFLDSNHADAGTRDPHHDMCADRGNTDPNWYCDAFLGPDNDGECAGTPGLWTSEEVCNDYFQQLWRDQMVWLDDLLNKSTADWQMIVTHFPPSYHTLRQLTPLVEKYGVDMIMAGHSHLQQVWYQQTYIDYDIGDTAWIISGGGGGVSSEGVPHVDWNKPGDDKATGHDDQYGFMDMVITKDHLSIKPYSHGANDDGSQILRRGAEVSRRPRSDGKDFRPVKPKTEIVVS